MEFVKPLLPFFVLQLGIGSALTVAVLACVIYRKTIEEAVIVGLTVCAVALPLAVVMMRWNLVIGGQEIAETYTGLLSHQLHY